MSGSVVELIADLVPPERVTNLKVLGDVDELTSEVLALARLDPDVMGIVDVLKRDFPLSMVERKLDDQAALIIDMTEAVVHVAESMPETQKSATLVINSSSRTLLAHNILLSLLRD